MASILDYVGNAITENPLVDYVQNVMDKNALMREARQEQEVMRLQEEAKKAAELRSLANQYTFDSGLLVEKMSRPDSPQGILSYNIAPPGNVDLEAAVMAQMNQQVKPPSKDLSDATRLALEVGDEKAGEINQRGFFDRLFSKETAMGLLDIFAQPEFIQAQRGIGGVSPLAAFSLAGAGKRQREAAAELEQQKIEAKARPKAPKPSTEVSRLYNIIQSAPRTTEIANQVKSLLQKTIPTGGLGQGIKALENIANFFNIPIDVSGKSSVNDKLAELKKAMIQARVFGRETNKQEQEIVNQLLPDASVLQNPERILKAMDRVIQDTERESANAANLLTLYGVPLPSETRRIRRPLAIESRR